MNTSSKKSARKSLAEMHPRMEVRCKAEGFRRCYGTGPEVMEGVAKFRRVRVTRKNSPHYGEWSTKSRQTKDMLTYNAKGKVVLKSRSKMGKASYKKLTAKGLTVRPNVFGVFDAEGKNLTQEAMKKKASKKTTRAKRNTAFAGF